MVYKFSKTKANLFKKFVIKILPTSYNTTESHCGFYFVKKECVTGCVIKSKTRRYPWGIQRLVSKHQHTWEWGWFSRPTQIQSAKICPNWGGGLLQNNSNSKYQDVSNAQIFILGVGGGKRVLQTNSILKCQDLPNAQIFIGGRGWYSRPT